jgi:hypothetical protein
MKKSRILSILVTLAVLLSLSLVTAVPAQAATEADIEASIVKGLAWLASVQQPGGSWQFFMGSDDPQYDVATTGLAVLKFEDRAKNLGLDPFDTANYPYANNVINGLNYIFSNAMQDANGVHFPLFYDVYNTGIAMMAVSASNHPGSVVVGGALNGMTYLQVVQGMMNWMALAQNGGADVYTGGWPYSAGMADWADQSNSGYATLGIGFAHAASPDGFGVAIPASVLLGLTTWISNVQINGGAYDGGSLYNPGWAPGTLWVNTLKTGNLLYELALTGVTALDPRATRAIAFISTYWGADGGEYDGAGWVGDYQAMFCMMKGLQAYGTTGIPGHPDWFGEVSTYIVANQYPDGHWEPTTGEAWSATISTAFALLTLEKAVPVIAINNYVTGGGTIGAKKPQWTFGGTVGARRDGTLVGQFEINDHVHKVAYHSTSITALEFSGDPATKPTATHNTAKFTAVFRGNDGSTKTVTVTIKDLGEKAPKIDTIQLAGGLVLAATALDSGNFQVHDGYK